jgi:O-acetylhomoserine/O-acetylserine sulfhydrylase-like pyridoxal-dependent enzyme
LQKTGLPLHTQVIEEEKTYDLREEIVEKVIYESNPFTFDEIIRRAEEYAAQNTTHIYTICLETTVSTYAIYLPKM